MLNIFPGKKKGKRSGCTELLQNLINEHQIEKVCFFPQFVGNLFLMKTS